VANPGRRKRSSEILSMLLEKADVQGYLTTDDLIEVYPDVNRDAERLQAVMTALRRRGVDILDRDSDTVQDSLLESGSDGEPFYGIESISSDDTIGLYLKEMSRVPLLSSDEELDLAKRIELGHFAKKGLERLNGRSSALRRQEL